MFRNIWKSYRNLYWVSTVYISLPVQGFEPFYETMVFDSRFDEHLQLRTTWLIKALYNHWRCVVDPTRAKHAQNTELAT